MASVTSHTQKPVSVIHPFTRQIWDSLPIRLITHICDEWQSLYGYPDDSVWGQVYELGDQSDTVGDNGDDQTKAAVEADQPDQPAQVERAIVTEKAKEAEVPVDNVEEKVGEPEVQVIAYLDTENDTQEGVVPDDICDDSYERNEQFSPDDSEEELSEEDANLAAEGEMWTISTSLKEELNSFLAVPSEGLERMVNTTLHEDYSVTLPLREGVTQEIVDAFLGGCELLRSIFLFGKDGASETCLARDIVARAALIAAGKAKCQKAIQDLKALLFPALEVDPDYIWNSHVYTLLYIKCGKGYSALQESVDADQLDEPTKVQVSVAMWLIAMDCAFELIELADSKADAAGEATEVITTDVVLPPAPAVSDVPAEVVAETKVDAADDAVVPTPDPVSTEPEALADGSPDPVASASATTTTDEVAPVEAPAETKTDDAHVESKCWQTDLIADAGYFDSRDGLGVDYDEYEQVCTSIRQPEYPFTNDQAELLAAAVQGALLELQNGQSDSVVDADKESDSKPVEKAETKPDETSMEIKPDETTLTRLFDELNAGQTEFSQEDAVILLSLTRQFKQTVAQQAEKPEAPLDAENPGASVDAEFGEDELSNADWVASLDREFPGL